VHTYDFPNPFTFRDSKETLNMSLAVHIRQHGGPEVLELVDVPVGEPGPGQVRIRHHAIGLNFIDVYHRSGLYPLTLPSGIGMEGAGVIEAVGEGVPTCRWVTAPPTPAHRPAATALCV